MNLERVVIPYVELTVCALNSPAQVIFPVPPVESVVSDDIALEELIVIPVAYDNTPVLAQ